MDGRSNRNASDSTKHASRWQKEMTMNRARIVVVTSLLYLLSGVVYAQVAGKAKVGVTVVQMEQVVLGWSAKKDLLDKPVYNDEKQEIGEINRATLSHLPSSASADFLGSPGRMS